MPEPAPRGAGDRGGADGYRGRELAIFAAATNWKRYVRTVLSPYIGANVLEVGAGLGAFTKTLLPASTGAWTCLEPDSEMAEHLRAAMAGLDRPCGVVQGRVADLLALPTYDTILYLDVLEHIERDREELASASDLLHAQGHLVVLAPAYGWLYSAFDRAIGHYRRYTRATLRSLSPQKTSLIVGSYLDSVGVLASFGNRILLGKDIPSASQIAFWDGTMVPMSEWIDPLLGYRMGRSVLSVWRKD